MNISKIKARIQQGFARPNLFRVTFANVAASKSEIFRINCYQAQIPGNNLALTEKGLGFRSYAYHRLYSDIILGFYCSENMQEIQLFQNWVDMIVNPKTNVKGYYSNDLKNPQAPGYTTDITIEQLSRLSSKGGEHNLGLTAPKLGANPIKREQELYLKENEWQDYDKDNIITARWKLEEAYPRQVDPIQLDYGTTDTVMSMNVTLTYRKFTVDFEPYNFSMEQYPLNHEQKYAKYELGQESGNRGTMSDMFPNMNQG